MTYAHRLLTRVVPVVTVALAVAGVLRGTAADDRDRRAEFLEMFARAYYPGRSGQVMIVPREGFILTRDDPAYLFMHGSPWDYDTRVPLIVHGPAFVREGRYVDEVSLQSVAPTIARLLRLPMPITVTGRALDGALERDAPLPAVVLVVVLDAMRADYLDRHADSLPILTGLRRGGADFAAARLNYLPSATALAHATVSTGTDPRVHGIVVNLAFDARTGKPHDPFPAMSPGTLMVPTLADLWNVQTEGRAVIAAIGGLYYAPAGLAGHGACFSNGRPIVMAAYDRLTGNWISNTDCFRLPDYLKSMNSRSLWESVGGRWMGHDVGNPTEIRRTALFPQFEADALVAIVEREPFGADDVPDLLLVNLKTPDFVGHKYGPDAPETAASLAAVDAGLGRVIEALGRKVGAGRVLVVVTADHGMPAEPSDSASMRLTEPQVVDMLHRRLDPQGGRLIQLYEASNAQIFVDRTRLRELGLGLRDVAAFLEQQPFIYAAFTEEEVREAASVTGSTR